ncbi:MAG: hypothetical protein LBM00_10740 [Deltaproteobacteria bacterium]|jgi:hypothetical protein|nr:hypothetical protein [Deltaproteobacteria bacterium]
MKRINLWGISALYAFLLILMPGASFAAERIEDKISGVWYYDAQKTYSSVENLQIMYKDIAKATGMSTNDAAEYVKQVLPTSIAVMEGGSLEINFHSNTLTMYTKTPPPELKAFEFRRDFSVLRLSGNSITLDLGATTMPSGAAVPGTIMKYSFEHAGDGRDVLVAEMVNGMKTYLYRAR